MIRPIAIGLAPNLEKNDAHLAWRKISNPFTYKRGNETYILEKWFEKYFSVASATAFSSGRGALYAILKALDIGKDDEVILQAFTCAAVVQAILTTGAIPIFVDIDESYTIDPKNLSKHITNKTKAIIVQHTFGITAALAEIQEISKKHKIFLIEDSAHSIGTLYKGKKIGTFGIASIFSFGRDKAFSSTSGGIAITTDKTIGNRIEMFGKQKNYPGHWWIFQQLFHPVAFYFFVLPFYNLLLGKILLVIFQKLHLLSLPVDTTRTVLIEDEVKKLPPSLSSLVLQQLKSLEKVNAKRKMIVDMYNTQFVLATNNHIAGPLLRYPLLVHNPEKVIKKLKKKGIYLGSWYSNTIDPKGVSFKKLQYVQGTCPKSEEIAQRIINLPTYFTLSKKQILFLANTVTKYA